MRQVIVAGSTGAVGREVVRQLGSRADVAVTALVRRAGSAPVGPNVRERLFDFKSDYEKIGTADLPCDVLICAVGTTMKQAGSQEAFLKIDRDIPVALVDRLAKLERGAFGLVSSVGADKPVGFYLNTKAQVEAAVRKSGVPYVIVRPSLILSDREKFRLGEHLATLAMVPMMGLAGAITGRRVAAVGKYMPIKAAMIAAALIRRTVDDPSVGSGAQGQILEGYALFAAAGRTP